MNYFVYLYLYFHMYFTMYVITMCVGLYVCERVRASVCSLLDSSYPVVLFH